MKTIKFYSIIATLVFFTSSCVENSEKYKSIVAQRDSLVMEKYAVDSNYNQTLVLLNDIENGFAEINQNESEMKIILKGIEGKKIDKREIISTQMSVIKDNMEQNKAKIAELRALASKKGKANAQLSATIKRLQLQMDESGVQIQTLQAELQQKNIKINELNTTLSAQNQNIIDQQNVLNQQKSTIEGQVTDLNTVWYCINSAQKLKEANIVSSGGLFQSKKIMNSDFDKKFFTQVDLRNISAITTDNKSIKIISSHPLSSYTLEIGDDKKITIKITNPAKFWSISKYLVVQI
jgi:chromosome segregation ATPase